jgi:integrase
MGQEMPKPFAEGFLDYVASLPKHGPLFPDIAPDKFGRRGGNATKIIGRWVRKQGIADPRKAPNHSWRHRFKDECRNAGIEKAIHDALTGHASDDEGDKYGLGYSLPVLAAAIAKLPSPVE